jgi:WD40 repeat protein
MWASGSFDGTVKLWDSATNQCKYIFQPLKPYEGMNITEVTGLTQAQKLTLKSLGAFET